MSSRIIPATLVYCLFLSACTTGTAKTTPEKHWIAHDLILASLDAMMHVYIETMDHIEPISLKGYGKNNVLFAEDCSKNVHKINIQKVERAWVEYSEYKCNDINLFLNLRVEKMNLESVNNAPIAVIHDLPTAPTLDSVTLDGSKSYDPNGDRIAYRWSIISAPTNSDSTIDRPTHPHCTFYSDTPGDYSIQLIVKDALGMSSTPAEVTFTLDESDSSKSDVRWYDPIFFVLKVALAAILLVGAAFK